MLGEAGPTLDPSGPWQLTQVPASISGVAVSAQAGAVSRLKTKVVLMDPKDFMASPLL
jgi:hypothetical protein